MESLKPSPEALARIMKRHRYMRPLFLAGTRPVVRFTTEGIDQVPKTGPLVVLANHVSAFDAPSINTLLKRPVIYLGAAGLVGKGWRSEFLSGIGVIPKKKFMSDARAVRALKGWVDAGAAVGVFPEGERTWDGAPLPFVPGIEKLIRLLGAPVVTARIHNADRHWPRWAPKPRRGRVHLSFDAPVKFERRADLDEVLSYIKERTVLDLDHNQRWPIRGGNLAVGLPNLVYSCPACGVLEAMVAKGSKLGCTACSRSWRVDTTNTLYDTQDDSSLTVADAASAVRERLGIHWVQDLSRFEAEGVVMESEPLTLTEEGSDTSIEIGKGCLQLRPDRLKLVHSEEEFSISLSEIRSVSIEMTRGLWIMTADKIYQPWMPRESVIKWRDVLVHWIDRHHASSAPS